MHSAVQYGPGPYGGVMPQSEMAGVYGGGHAMRPPSASVSGDSMSNPCSAPQPGAPPSYPVVLPNR